MRRKAAKPAYYEQHLGVFEPFAFWADYFILRNCMPLFENSSAAGIVAGKR
jgi:hypothetical protein